MLIVDAYNLLHAASGRRGKITGLSLRQLCDVCAEMKLTLVMDGVRKPREPAVDDYATLQLQWAGRGRSADDAIVNMCESSTGRRDICVVTDDRQLQSRVKHLGARALHCGMFLRQLHTYRHLQRHPAPASPAKPAGETTAGETQFWMRVFGFLPSVQADAPKPGKSPSGVQTPRAMEELTEADIDAIDMRVFLD